MCVCFFYNWFKFERVFEIIIFYIYEYIYILIVNYINNNYI